MRSLVPISLALLLAACTEEPAPIKRIPESAGPVDSARAKALIGEKGCGSCHVIPGIASAQGRVGPPLEAIAQRSYLAGLLPNTYGNMIAWLSAPQAVDPDTAMPDTGLSPEEAGILAVWLYTLE